MPVLRLHDQHGTRRESKSKSMREHSIRPPRCNIESGGGQGDVARDCLDPHRKAAALC